MTSSRSLTRPAKCARCAGTGWVDSTVNMGRCYTCGGAGEVETDRAAIAAAKVRTERRRALGHAAIAHSMAAHVGLNRLEQDEPERLTKALDAYAAGHPGVLDALATYGR